MANGNQFLKIGINMELRWEKIRDEKSCEVYHEMYDTVINKYVAKIHKEKRGYQVQILNRVPWKRRTLKSAKIDCEHIYINCK